jgi:hypothetical protein
LAQDKHQCGSSGEKQLDDWLFINKISHKPQKRIGWGRRSCDQYVEFGGKNYYIEFDGFGYKKREEDFFEKLDYYKERLCNKEFYGYVVVNETNLDKNLTDLFFTKIREYQGEFIFKEQISKMTFAYRLHFSHNVFRYCKDKYKDKLQGYSDYKLTKEILNLLVFNENFQTKCSQFFDFDTNFLFKQLLIS